MGKMPAGLKRYWASRRRGKKKGGKVMARRVRMGRRRRYSGRLRAAGRRAKGMFSKPTRFLGFKKDGFHVSDALIAAGLVVPAFLQTTSATESSAIGAMMGRGQYASYSFENKVRQALDNYAVATLGVQIDGTVNAARLNKGVGAMAVGSGIVMKVAGNAFANKLMHGSAVKL